MAAKKDSQSKIRENRYKKRRPRSVPKSRNWLGSLLSALGGAAAIIAMSLVFVFGYDWATQSDYFRAETVEVHGTRRLDPELVKEAAGIGQGVNIFSVNLSTARRRLLAMGWVAEAEVRRQFPSAMIIRIREHEPVALIDLGKTFMINSDGRIFRQADEGESADLPLVKGISYPDWQSPGPGQSRIVTSVMAVLKQSGKSQSVFDGHRIEEIRVDPDLGLVLEIKNLPVKQVQLGYGGYGKKLGRFGEVLAYLKNRQPSVELEKMDLRNPDRIVGRPAEEKQSAIIRQKEA